MSSGQGYGSPHLFITMAPEASSKLNKNMLVLLLVYTIIILFSLYFVLRASMKSPQYHLTEYAIRDNVAPMVTRDRTVTKNIPPTLKTDTPVNNRSYTSVDRPDPDSKINCSLAENTDHFWEHVQSVLEQLSQDESTAVLQETKGAYNLGNIAEYIVSGVCMSGTLVTGDQHGRLMESIMTATNATNSPTVMNARPEIKKYYHSILNDQKVFDLRCDTCALVSSSGRILGSKAGADIDNHACVIRMNNAPSHSFEEDVGSRTTVRLGSFVLVQAMNHSNYRFLLGEERGEYNLYWGMDKKKHPTLKTSLRTVLMGNGSHTEVYYAKPEGEDEQNQLFKNMTGRNRVDSKTWLSTGWFTFQLALDLCDKLDVYGMIPDNYCSKNSTKVRYHYYQPGQKPMECETYKFVESTKKHAHRFMTEKAVFAKWAVMYNVSFYHPTWNPSGGASKNISTPFMTLPQSRLGTGHRRTVVRRRVVKRPAA